MIVRVMSDLFAFERREIRLDAGAIVLEGFARAHERELLDAIEMIAAASPFRHLETPGGRRMSVAMTNTGHLGWVSDRSGYRYDSVDPVTGRHWPAMPAVLRQLARDAAKTAGFESFAPEACLVNRYEPGARLSLHQDKDEKHLDQPIVSVSLGVDAIFLWGGQSRADRPRRLILRHGDVVVWGGPARLTYHGIDPLGASDHPLTGQFRYNLTFRTAV